jgi:hypothetical protein
MDKSFFYLGIIGFIGILAITLSRLIDKPAFNRNFTFSILIISAALAYISEMARNDFMLIGGLKLGFISLIILACLVGAFTEFVLASIYRGYLLAAAFSGALTGMTAFFMWRFLPPSGDFYQDFHSFPELTRWAITFIVSAGSYVFFCIWTDAQNRDEL